MTKKEEFEKALAQFDLDGDFHPLEEFADHIDVNALPHKTTFTILGESQGRTWESSWLIPRDITEVDWMEIQRMLKLAMTTLCRLPIDEAIGVVDPEGYKRLQENKRKRKLMEEREAQAVYGEKEYTPKYDEDKSLKDGA